MKRTLCILLSLMFTLTGLVGLGVSASAVAVGEIIEFGNYPQTRVGETTALKNAANAATWNSYGYYIGNGSYDGKMAASDFMKYADFFSSGVKYRAVKFTKYRPYATRNTSGADNSYQDENGYSPNTTYYFKYESLKWRVLNPSSCLVMCETIIDAQAYQNVVRRESASDIYYYYIGSTSTFANNYAESSIRAWLNNDFYNTAFNNTQKANIRNTTISNDAYPSEHSLYSSVWTTDPIFLLSYDEVRQSIYGFSDLESKKAKGTDYAKCQGLHVEDSGFSGWRLRTAGEYSGMTRFVQYHGGTVDDENVARTCLGIRPACCLSDLTSDTSQNSYTVTATANPTAGGTVTGGGAYSDGQSATLTATNNPGYLFSGWYKDGVRVSSNKSYTFTVIEDVTLTAKFSTLSMSYTVTANANPSEGGTVSGGGDYYKGDTATVTATPKNGWKFTGWFDGNNIVSSSASYSFTVTENVTLSARFERDVKLNVPQPATVEYKSTVNVTATADNIPTNYFVALYDGDIQLAKGDNKTVSYTMTKMKAGKTLTAKIIDSNGNVQSTADGKMEKDITITVKTGFFAKLKAFFQSLFGLLPQITLNP